MQPPASLLVDRRRLGLDIAAGIASSLLLMVPMATGHPLRAQAMDDVTLLGQRYGTEVPAAYYQLREAQPGAFEFERGWFNRLPNFRGAGGAGGGDAGANPVEQRVGALVSGEIFGEFDGRVEGTFRFPLLTGYFADDFTPPAIPASRVQEQFFDGPNPTGTIRDYYLEASGGRVELRGESSEWVQSSLTRDEVTGGNSGLGGSPIGEFLLDLLRARDDGPFDWGVYDNDGPDGRPNSGDDDGFVDVLAVMHPTRGAECGGSGSGSRIWSHRWTIVATTGAPYTTRTPAAGGGFIRVSDYTIQPLLDCSGSEINQIGVFAHELGHGFGLPDLYATGGSGHAGIGTWGLMGSGSWGCANVTPERPCQLSAWTREALGWGTFQDLPADADLRDVTFRSPVEGGTIYRYRVPGSSEYYLLEHRERIGFDSGLREPGLLVWQITPEIILQGGNRVNSDPARMGVWLRQADGANHLGLTSGGNRGDADDPFPGATGAAAFHAGTTPTARLLSGEPSALTLLGIERRPGESRARVATGRRRLTLRAEGAEGTATLEVDGIARGTGITLDRAPFETVEVVAAGGELGEDGARVGFLGWSDGVTPRMRTLQIPVHDTALTARYGEVEYRVTATLTGGRNGVLPGRLETDPPRSDLWFLAGTPVTFTAVPEPGFTFAGWDGALAGSSNPTERTLSEPLDVTARFTSEFGLVAPEPLTFAAGDPVDHLLAVEGGVGTLTFRVMGGTFPAGLSLAATGGKIFGSPLETGSFAARIRVTDGRGLSADADIEVEVTVPELGIEDLTARFLGRLDPLPTGRAIWLDRTGNGNGRYDLGDAVLYLRRQGGGG